MSALLDTAKQAVSLALKKGAKEAAATATKSRDVTIGWRDGKVEKVSEATTRGGDQEAEGYELLHRRDPGGVRNADAHRVRVITKAVGPLPKT